VGVGTVTAIYTPRLLRTEPVFTPSHIAAREQPQARKEQKSRGLRQKQCPKDYQGEISGYFPTNEGQLHTHSGTAVRHLSSLSVGQPLSEKGFPMTTNSLHLSVFTHRLI